MAREALIRKGPRGSGNYAPIGVEDALRTATMWLSPLVHAAPQAVSLCIGQGADMALARHWMAEIGSGALFSDRAISAANAPRPRARNKDVGLVLVIGSSMGRGGAHTQAQLARWRQQGARLISINPVKTGLSKLADQWLAITPGSDLALLKVLAGLAPSDYAHLATTGLSVLDVENLQRALQDNKGKCAILAGRGLLAHRNGSKASNLLEEIADQFGADILPFADAVFCPKPLTRLLAQPVRALILMGSDLPWQSQTRAQIDRFAGHIIALSDEPDSFRRGADLVLCGAPEDNLLKLAARLGTKGFSDQDGNSPFKAGFNDYQRAAEAAEPKPQNAPSLDLRQATPALPDNDADEGAAGPSETDFPFVAISQKAPADANRTVVFIEADRARFLGFAARDKVTVVSPSGSLSALLATYEDMNPNTLWCWGGELFAPLMPKETPIIDPMTGQPAWFDLKVRVEKA